MMLFLLFRGLRLLSQAWDFVFRTKCFNCSMRVPRYGHTSIHNGLPSCDACHLLMQAQWVEQIKEHELQQAIRQERLRIRARAEARRLESGDDPYRDDVQ